MLLCCHWHIVLSLQQNSVFKNPYTDQSLNNLSSSWVKMRLKYIMELPSMFVHHVRLIINILYCSQLVGWYPFVTPRPVYTILLPNISAATDAAVKTVLSAEQVILTG
ncbi:hypothetical protein XENORESO_004852 [Xenotaenia resolanae]|uniref:Uncharacterized protein n=1 Tax=Xenotaenia resolanae TaxID=208358 RepID=A0ABV0X140_9TELE